MLKSVQNPCSKPTRRPCDLHSTDIDLPPRYRIPARHDIKRRHRSVESTVSMVNRRHHQRPRDSLRIGISEIPARAARGGVPGHDGGGGGDVREGREVSEIVKASGDEAVLPVGAGDGGEDIGGDTVVVVVAQDDAHRGGEKDEECGEGVLHFGWLVGRFAGPAIIVGGLLFSSSIFALVLNSNLKVLGPVTPLGGLVMIAGYTSLIF